MELHSEDVVALRSDDTVLGVVERTHGDIDSHQPYPGRIEPATIHHDRTIKKAAFNKFMKDGVPPKGTAFIRWQHTENAQLIPESKLLLVDRSLIMGDVVKRNTRDAMSGVVINTFTKCTLQPMCDLSLKKSHQENNHLKGILHPSEAIDSSIQQSKPDYIVDVPASELKYDAELSEEGLVIYKDWIGTVDSVALALTVRLSNNSVVEISDDLAEHADDAEDQFDVGDIVSTKKGHLRSGKWIYGQYNPNTMPIGTVVQTRNVSAEITWLQRRIGSSDNGQEPPSLLERDELESDKFRIYDKTRRPQTKSVGSVPETVSNSEIEAGLGLRVRFKDLSGACGKYDGSSGKSKLSRIDRKDTLGYDINVFALVKFQTEVTVQWQDLSITRERSIDVVSDSSIDDEHAAWPGEIAHSLDFSPVPNMPGISQPGKVGVVQSVNSSERMAKVRWCEGACLQYAQDIDENPGLRSLLTAVTGTTGIVDEEVSLYDIEAPGALNVRRGDMVLITPQRWKEVDPNFSFGGINWFGEVVETCLDGTLTIRLGAALEVRDVSLRREDIVIAIRSDGTEGFDGWDDESMDDEIWAGGSNESEMEVSGEEDDEGESEEEDIDVRYEDENGKPLDEDEVEDEDWESDDEEAEIQEDVEMADAPPLTPPEADDRSAIADVKREALGLVDEFKALSGSFYRRFPNASHSAAPPVSSTQDHEMDSQSTETDSAPTPTPSPPEPHLIIDREAPPDHHFASQPSAENSTHMKRVQKEHKILRSANALPYGVYVRTWESRLDLLRVLFIGPAETPYADAPFVIDFYLDSNFPTDPPRAFFHSWTGESGLGGVGRVNPNLYEDGKICLSLLGTWEGSKGEGWVASRSTILQVLVSLLGLVLVREPYFNEAGYEPLAGLESSKRPSALYNERTYLQARTFVISALTGLGTGETAERAGLEDLEDVVRWLYKDASGPRLLQRVVGEVDKVLRRSEGSGEELDGLNVMSKGACIPLRRVRDRLRELMPSLIVKLPVGLGNCT